MLSDNFIAGNLYHVIGQVYKSIPDKVYFYEQASCSNYNNFICDDDVIMFLFRDHGQLCFLHNSQFGYISPRHTFIKIS
jgi:hypothetical protein